MLGRREKRNHAIEVGRNRLLKLGGHKHGHGRQGDHFFLVKISRADSFNISVEDRAGDEQRLLLVLLLLVQVEDALDAVGA